MHLEGIQPDIGSEHGLDVSTRVGQHRREHRQIDPPARLEKHSSRAHAAQDGRDRREQWKRGVHADRYPRRYARRMKLPVRKKFATALLMRGPAWRIR